MNNPYQSPDSSVDDADFNYDGQKLYRISGIGLATFLGGVLAGGILLSQNFRKMGQIDYANKALAISVAAFVVILVMIFAIPENYNPPSVVYTIAQTLAMVRIAKHYQQTKINIHEYNKRKFHSNWLALGIALLVVAAIFVAAIVFSVATGVTV